MQVESTDFHVHRNVMASVSPYLMELFSAEQVNIDYCLLGYNRSLPINKSGAAASSTECHGFTLTLPIVRPQQTQKVVPQGEGAPSYILNGGMTKIAIQILIDYAYTSALEVPDALVKDVYLAAWKLRMETVVNECARHLITELTPDSCIEIRSLPGISGNKTLIAALDSFINSNVSGGMLSAGRSEELNISPFFSSPR